VDRGKEKATKEEGIPGKGGGAGGSVGEGWAGGLIGRPSSAGSGGAPKEVSGDRGRTCQGGGPEKESSLPGKLLRQEGYNERISNKRPVGKHPTR